MSNVINRAWAAVLAVVLGGCAAVSAPYGAPPETSDPWQLIGYARQWLQQGRPRGALPSLNKALTLLGNDTSASADTVHAKAAVYNEYGRVYEMVSELDQAERMFLQAETLAQQVPDRRPLQLDIHYNLSTVYERQGDADASCRELRLAASLAKSLLQTPSAPPFGYGSTSTFIRDTAQPKIRARSRRIGCSVD